MAHLLEADLWSSSEAQDLLADRPELTDVDLTRLAELPAGTLGRSFADFLEEHDLDYGLADKPVTLVRDEDEAYLLRRIRQNHDLWHVLLDYGIEGHEEVLVHVFTLAQLGMPSSLAISTLGALKHMVGEGRWGCLRRTWPDVFRLGHRAAPLIGVYWERRWEQPLDAVRQDLGIVPVPVA